MQDKEFFSTEDSNISNIIDASRGVRLPDYQTSQDQRKMSLTGSTHIDPRKASELINFQGLFSLRQSFGWLEFTGSYTTAEYGRITSDNLALGPASADLMQSQVTLLTFGAGLSYRTTYAQDFLGTSWFETVSAALTYTMMNEPERELQFNGFGLKTDFGLHKRVSPSYFWGLKSSYHISSVQTSELENSPSYSERSLIIQWFTIGLELGFYF